MYFPLHLQPELTTDILGGGTADQLLAIEELARALPSNILIYAKENPKQSLYMRDPSFFRRLRDIPSVRYLPIEVPSLDLVRRSIAVATVTGTAGWEAIQMGKPAFCFGYAWFRGLPGAFEWEKVKHCAGDTISSFQFDKEALQNSFRKRCSYLWPGIVDRVYGALIPNYNEDQSFILAVRSVLAYLRCIGFDGHGHAIAPVPNAVNELAS